jgi:hypothetical protein
MSQNGNGRAGNAAGISVGSTSNATENNRQSRSTQALVAIAIEQLATEPHDTILGLFRRYYYRGNFVLLEHLTARGLAKNIERLRRRGEDEHAERLQAAWKASR